MKIAVLMGSPRKKDRFVRLGIPVIIIPFIILPILLIPLYAGNKSPVDFIFKEYFNPSKGLFQLAHTWFLVDLLIFTCFYALYKGIKKYRKDNKPELLKVPGNLKIGLFALGLSFILFAIRIFIPTGWWAPLHLFEPGRFPAYIAMFIVGLVAYKHKWIEKIPTSTGVLWGIVSVEAILAAPAIDVFILGGTYMWAKGFTLNSLVVSAWDAILCVGLCTSMIVLFRQKFNFQNKVLKTMANDSFAVYLIHPFLLVWLHVLILNVPMHPIVKFIAVTIAGTIICYALSHLIKKIPGVSKVL
jgi:surface polysaccharide O-acyltransferase-like enzyme